MSDTDRRSLLAAPRLTLWLGLLLPLLALARLGQDGNWDLQNYHLYDAHAWLHGRDAIDIAPAQLQTWHNPLLDLPLYLMQAAGIHGALIGVWLTMPMMLGLYLLLRLPERVGETPTAAGTFALAIVAVSGVAAFSALGSSFNDAFIAAGMLASLSLLFAGADAVPPARRLLAAGLIAGMTAGLKLTAGTYCLGLAAAVYSLEPGKGALRRLSCLLAGGVAGLLLTYGYWGLHLLQLHGNPFFPYFNQVFQSPDAQPLPFADLRFRPQTLQDVLLVPIRLLSDSQLYSEPTIRDPRMLLGTVGFLMLSLLPTNPENSDNAPTAARRRALAVFFYVSLLAWAIQYGIYRYALPLEMLGSLALVLVLQRLPGRFAASALAMAVVMILAMTNHANWGRGAFRQPMVSIQMPALPPGSMVTTGSFLPVAFVASALPDSVPLVSFFNNFMRPDRCTRLQARVEQRITTHEGPLWLLRGTAPSADEALGLAQTYYGLEVSGTCLPVTTSLGDLSLCPLRRLPRPPSCAPPPVTPGR